jgi:hypothetical protein
MTSLRQRNYKEVSTYTTGMPDHTPPPPIHRHHKMTQQQLKDKVDELYSAIDAGQFDNDNPPVLVLEDTEFTECVDVPALLRDGKTCPFAWHVKQCTFLRGFEARNVVFKQTVDFGRKWFEGNALENQFHGNETIFYRAEFHGNETSFSHAKFHCNETHFGDAKFHGDKTNFDRAKFHCNETRFSFAEFHGILTSFERAEFQCNKTIFEFAKFHGNETSFSHAKFHCNETHFGDAKFHGDKTSFDCAEFHGNETRFSFAEFHGIQTCFDYAEFHGNKTNFDDAKFRSSQTSFYCAEFHGNKTTFWKAYVVSNNIDFSKVQFRSQKTTFAEARFLGANTVFRRAKFYGEQVHWQGLIIKGEMIFDTVKFYEDSCCWFDNLVFKNSYFIRKKKSSAFIRLVILHTNKKSVKRYGTLHFSNIRTTDTQERIVIRYDSLIKLSEKHPVCIEFDNCTFRPGNVTVSHVNNRIFSIKLSSTENKSRHGNGLLGFTFEDCDWVSRSLGRFRWSFDWLGLGLRLAVAPMDNTDIAKAMDQQSAMLRLQKTYERLKKSLDEHGDSLTASHFHFWSLWYLTRREPWSLGRAIRIGYLLTSAFGLSLCRPLVCLLVSSGWFALVYALIFQPLDVLPRCADWTMPWRAGLDLSLMHPNPLEGLELKGVNLVKFLQSLPGQQLPYWGGWVLWPLILVQNSFQLYLLVMFGAAVRNRVKR